MVSKIKGDDNMLKKIILAVMLVAATVILSGFSEAAEEPKWVLIHDVHYVMNGEDLDQITRVYMKKNTYGPRGFKEFREGIIELNGLRGKTVSPGQELSINYWVRPEDIIWKGDY